MSIQAKPTGKTEFFLELASSYQQVMDFTKVFNQEFSKMLKKRNITQNALQKELASSVYKKLEEGNQKTFDRKSVEKWLNGTIPDNLHQLVMIAHFFQKEELEDADDEKQVENLYFELNQKYLLPAKGKYLYIRKTNDLALYLAWRFDKFDDYSQIVEDINVQLSKKNTKDSSTQYEEENLHACKTYEDALNLIGNHSNFYEAVDRCIRKRLQDKLGILDIAERNSSLRGNLSDLNRGFILEICAIREIDVLEVEELLRLNHMQTFIKKPWGRFEYLALVDWEAARKREQMAERMKLKNPQVHLETEDFLRYHKIWKKNAIGKISFCLCLGEALFSLEEKGIYYNFYSVNYILDRLVSSIYRTSTKKLTKDFLIERLDKISEDVTRNIIIPEINHLEKEKREQIKELSNSFSQASKDKKKRLKEEIKELRIDNHPKSVYITEKELIVEYMNGNLTSKTPMYYPISDEGDIIYYTQYLYVAIMYSVFTGHSFWGSTMSGYTDYLQDLRELGVKRSYMMLLKIFRDILDEKKVINYRKLITECLNGFLT